MGGRGGVPAPGAPGEPGSRPGLIVGPNMRSRNPSRVFVVAAPPPAAVEAVSQVLGGASPMAKSAGSQAGSTAGRAMSPQLPKPGISAQVPPPEESRMQPISEEEVSDPPPFSVVPKQFSAKLTSCWAMKSQEDAHSSPLHKK